LQDLAPAFSKLGTVLLLIMALFGQVAIPLFGGDIYLENPALVRISGPASAPFGRFGARFLAHF